MRKIIGLLLVGALALPIYLTSTASAGVATDLELRERFCGTPGSHCKNVGSRSGSAFGDRLIFTLPLEMRADGSKVGRSQGECATLHKSSDSFFCDYNLYLGDGMISVQGTMSLDLKVARMIPITGGTGAYEGATGTLRQKGPSVDVHIVVP